MFEIQIRDQYGEWQADLAGSDGNQFRTEAEAVVAIEGLRRLDVDWANAQYRIVPIEPFDSVATLSQLLSSKLRRRR